MKALRWLFLAAPLFLAFEANASPADQLNPICSINQPCYCTQDWDPVCGMDGETYGNACGARCACMPIAYGGECIDECKVCVGTKLDPVCGDDGQTYGNSCYAKCNKATPKYEGACQPYETPGPGPIPPPIHLQ